VALAAVALSLPACNGNCATYLVTVVVEDEASGQLICDATVTFATGDAGLVVDGSAAPSDAEVPAASGACQWDRQVGGGTYEVTASAPGFLPGTTTLRLATDTCGSTTAPVTVVLVRS
jgi:hypothetical protein